MANIKSQKKRVITNEKARVAHKSEKSALKTSLKKVDLAIAAGDKQAAQEALKLAHKQVDKAVTDGTHSKNWAARQKSRYTKAVNNMA